MRVFNASGLLDSEHQKCHGQKLDSPGNISPSPHLAEEISFSCHVFHISLKFSIKEKKKKKEKEGKKNQRLHVHLLINAYHSYFHFPKVFF